MTDETLFRIDKNLLFIFPPIAEKIQTIIKCPVVAPSIAPNKIENNFKLGLSIDIKIDV